MEKDRGDGVWVLPPPQRRFPVIIYRTSNVTQGMNGSLKSSTVYSPESRLLSISIFLS